MENPKAPQTDYDIVIIGGSFSGSTSGILLKRAMSKLRILIVEKSEEFDRKVGESTSEVAGCFLTKVLGLTRYLSQHQVPKHGLRMWFTKPESDCMGESSEIGAYYQVRLPTFQLDRSTFDQHLLEEAQEMGCELIRPGTIRNVDVESEVKTVEIKAGGETRTVTSRWVMDASGKAAVLARKLGHLRKLDEHATNAMWVRMRNVKDLDSYEFKKRFPDYGNALPSNRGLATNHLMGHGWWVWIIPLKNGDVSVGLTYDSKLFEPPKGGSIGERLKEHLMTDPVGRELFGDAEPVEKDARAYTHLPYYSERVMGDGWAIVGDAAGFMDPLYSQGLDYCSHSVYSAVQVMRKGLRGRDIAEDTEQFNEQYQTSYMRWYKALYRNKYNYLGDAELMYAAFLLDIGTYFFGPVWFVYKHTYNAFARMPYIGRVGGWFADFMRIYNKRFSAIAEKRLAAGTYGKKNLHHRFLVGQGFTPGFAVAKLLVKGVAIWWKCEIQSLFLRKKNSKPDMESLPESREASAQA